jgi:hypothetical protein
MNIFAGRVGASIPTIKISTVMLETGRTVVG